MFIGRSKELSELNNRYGSGRKEFGVIYGRKRIGKSALITKFLEDKYHSIPFDINMLEHLKESASIFPEKYQREYFIFSKSGFVDDVRQLENANLHLVDLANLLKLS